MGRWTRANAEVCLLATRGKPKRISESVHSVIDTPIERHSKKPDVVRQRIVQLLGDIPRIELFAREAADGWDVWGNEV
jgi:N6-adenosine-specific RNA methylase IME4